MQFGVFQNLEELDACFKGASLETIREIKRITPNLKKLVIHEASSDTINAMLETLDNLEAAKIRTYDWKIGQKVCPKIRYLDASFKSRFSAEKFSKLFPNLEYLKIDHCSVEVSESFFINLLSDLPQLKTFYIKVWSSTELNPKTFSSAPLQCFQKHGKHLEEANIVYEWAIAVRQPVWSQYVSDVGRFAIEKRPEESFCINTKDCSFDASWMRKIF
jgi:hypothetical protein